MALNPNHAFEDIGDVKCAIVEKNCTPERTDFLKRLLEHNNYTVVIAKTPPPKAKPAAKPAPKPAGAEAPAVADTPAPPPPPEPVAPDTYTVGVTDVTFSPINAVFNRELLTPDGHVVTKDYWKQRTSAPVEDEWYWNTR